MKEALPPTASSPGRPPTSSWSTPSPVWSLSSWCHSYWSVRRQAFVDLDENLNNPSLSFSRWNFTSEFGNIQPSSYLQPNILLILMKIYTTQAFRFLDGTFFLLNLEIFNFILSCKPIFCWFWWKYKQSKSYVFKMEIYICIWRYLILQDFIDFDENLNNPSLLFSRWNFFFWMWRYLTLFLLSTQHFFIWMKISATQAFWFQDGTLVPNLEIFNHILSYKPIFCWFWWKSKQPKTFILKMKIYFWSGRCLTLFLLAN